MSSNFTDFLYSHIPHRWLNKKAQGTKKLFDGIAGCMDYAESFSELVKRNNSISTADEIIEELENEYGIDINPSYDIDFRRRRIIAKMRMQDCPITKEDILNMLNVLGFKNCSVTNHLNEFVMDIRFEPETLYGYETKEASKFLEQNIRAHIDFWLRALINSSVYNKNFFLFHRAIFKGSFFNFGYSTLNGERRLDGSFRLGAADKSIYIERLTFWTGIRYFKDYVTLDGRKKLDGSFLLNSGDRKLPINFTVSPLRSYFKSHFYSKRICFEYFFRNSSFNGGMDYVILDGSKNLDGSFELISLSRCFYFNRAAFSVRILNFTADYIALDGERNLDGRWLLSNKRRCFNIVSTMNIGVRNSLGFESEALNINAFIKNRISSPVFENIFNHYYFKYRNLDCSISILSSLSIKNSSDILKQNNFSSSYYFENRPNFNSRLNSVSQSTAISESFNHSVSLTSDRMWHIDGSFDLSGQRRLGAVPPSIDKV